MRFKQQLDIPTSFRPIAIIGAGGIVNDAHLPAYLMSKMPIMGIYDIDRQKAIDLKKKFPQIEKVYSNLEALISSAQDSNVIYDLAVPANHIIPILRSIPEGSAILIQKPMGENLREAKEINDICQERKLISAVNFQLRFAPYICAAKDIIEQYLIGEVFDVEIKVCVHTPWELWDFLFEKPRVEVLYHSIHYLDLVRHLMGNPSSVHASTIKHPKAKAMEATRSSIILDYDGIKQARILTNHGHDYGLKHQESYLKIEGTKGAIKIKIGVSLDYPKGEPPSMEVVFSEDNKGWLEVPLQGGWFPHAFRGNMIALQSHVMDRSITLPHSTKDALKTMQLVEAVYTSSDNGGLQLEWND